MQLLVAEDERRMADLLKKGLEEEGHSVVLARDGAVAFSMAQVHPFDLIVVTHADEATRVQRMVGLRGMPEAEAVRRIRSQASDAERLAVADVIIDTTGTLGQTLAQVDDLWHRVRAAAAEPTVSGAP